VLGGDFNIRGLALEGFDRAGRHEVDYVFVRGLSVAGDADVLDRGRLSDHAPLSVAIGY
jgi:endonuclease/exonuclease/phosphatase (EEP) superfamily protein YafD